MNGNILKYGPLRRRIDDILQSAEPYTSDYALSGGRPPVRRYHVFTVPKKSGGHRVISAPVRELLELQHELADWLARYYDPRPCVTGFVKGMSVVDNARIHSGRRFVFNADLQDFFPSISMGRVLRTIMEEPFCLDYKQASTLAKICCYLVPHFQQMVLPQGAPTSPVLSNIVCEALDRKLTALSKEYALRGLKHPPAKILTVPYAINMSCTGRFPLYGGDHALVNNVPIIWRETVIRSA